MKWVPSKINLLTQNIHFIKTRGKLCNFEINGKLKILLIFPARQFLQLIVNLSAKNNEIHQILKFIISPLNLLQQK